MSVEVWKAVKGYEGLYEVSSHGRVKSLKRLHTKERILCQAINHKGYARVVLWKENKQRKFSVHRLVAQAFIENPEAKPQVNHIDENKLNNRVENLEWCSQLENHRHGTINERISKSLTNNPKKSKPVTAYDDEGNSVFSFPSVYEASRKTGINVSSIRDCLHKRTKHAGGYIWQFQ